MTQFPSALDTDTDLPPVNDNITEIGAEAINAIREAVFAIETEVGLNGSGSSGSIANRIGVSLNPDGTLRPSAIASAGLVSLPIYNYHVAVDADILESKLKLDHKTQDLYNYIKDLSLDVNTSIGWINSTGVKLNPHISGALYKHELSAISVSNSPSLYFKNKFNLLRDNTNAFTALNELNSDFVNHQQLDGYGSGSDITTVNGSTYKSNFAHTASGIYINPNRFSTVPQTTDNLQDFADYIDSASLLLLGSRVQNFYANGISKSSRSSSLSLDGYGQSIIPPTLAKTYFLNDNTSTSPVDDIDTGDDIIELTPSNSVLTSNLFDSQFAAVKPGDILRVNYGTVEVQFVVKEKKYSQSGPNKKFIIRIAGKNLFYTTNASVRIDRPLFNPAKYGVLSVSGVNNQFSKLPSLLIGAPKGAVALGLGFDPQLFDSDHYVLYLALFPTGNASDGYIFLPGIDITGNLGTTPGKYTIDSIVEATNNAFRNSGFNYRFAAFQYEGEFGIMLADSFNNAGFSIVSGVINPDGSYNQSLTNISFPKNVVGLFGINGKQPVDPLGFGQYGSAIASPPYVSSYSSAASAIVPTKLFIPLKRNNYYVNGVETDKFNLDVDQILDGYGDGYWNATIINRIVYPGSRVQITYQVNKDLSQSKLAPGKTLVVQSNGSGDYVDFGRFIIKDVLHYCDSSLSQITVYDAVHGIGVSPADSSDVGTNVRLYFDAGSVGFNIENSTDITGTSHSFKRGFEVFIDSAGNTFTHERARFNISGSNTTVNGITFYSDAELNYFNIIEVSPKLRGYKFYNGTNYITKITLNISAYDSTTGYFDGYLATYDGVNLSRLGPTTHGRIGETVRFYDETNIDYIELIFAFNNSTTFGNKRTDIQLFPSLRSDDELMPLALCQVNDVTNAVEYIQDIREFGNISEKQLTSSALDFLSAGDRLLHENGVISGFDISEDYGNPILDQIIIKGGTSLVNGNFSQLNNSIVSIPIIREVNINTATEYNINWALCVNDKNEFKTIPLLDYDSALATPNSGNRVFWARNPITGGLYNLDAILFSDLINNRKDLCLLYIVASTVSGSGLSTTISLSITDARKYVNDGDSNLPLRLTVDKSQGNFRSPVAVFNWVKYNGKFNGIAYLKGANSTVSTNLNLDFDNSVIIDGENNCNLVFTGNVSFGSNLTLKNMTITFNGSVSTISNASNLIFDNCIITINNIPASTTPFNFSNSNHIVFKDSDVNFNYAADPGGTCILATNSSDINIDNSNFTVNYFSTNAGNIIELDRSQNIYLNRSIFSGNFVSFMKIDGNYDNVMKLQIKDCTITSSYIATSLPSWSSSDLVYYRSGMIYSSLQANLSDVLIQNTVFNFTPGSASNNRVPFISFVFASGNITLKNLTIKDCQFNNNSIGVDDRRPAVCIMNTATGGTSSSSQPVLLNCEVSNNICNNNQMIVITSKTDVAHSPSLMKYPGLAAVNVNVFGNVCGTIGYFVSSGTRVNNIPTMTTYNSNGPGLNISGNDCHYICNMDHAGRYLALSKSGVNYSQYPTGYVRIYENSTNWIHTGCAYEENSSLTITNNSLNAYDTAYLDSYNDNAANITSLGYTNPIPMYSYAISITGNYYQDTATVPGTGNNSNVIINNNSTNTGIYVNSLFVPVSYEYGGYIFSMVSASISNNILKGIAQNTAAITGSVGICVGGKNSSVINNKIYRNTRNIYAYVYHQHPFTDPTTTSYGIVVDNYFDYETTDGTTEDVSVNIPNSWTYERNKNQTMYMSIPFTDKGFQSGGATGFGYSQFNAGYYVVGTADNFGNRSNNTLVVDIENANPQRYLTWQIPVSTYIPTNTTLIEVKSGFKCFAPGGIDATDPTKAYCKIYLNKYVSSKNFNNVNLDYFGTNPVAVDTNLTTLSSYAYSEITGLMMNSTANTQYLDINLKTSNLGDIRSQYITGKDYEFTVSMDLRWIKTGPGVFARFIISPIVCKFRW